MAEPFSLATGVFACIQLLDRFTSLSIKAWSSARNAPEDIRKLQTELGSLRSALDVIYQEIAHNQAQVGEEAPSSTNRLSCLDGPVKVMEQDLTTLTNKLAKLSVSKTARLKWALFDENRLQGEMQKVERFKSLFTVAAEIDDR